MGANLEVFGTQSSVITEASSEALIAKGDKEEDKNKSDEAQYRQVNVKMLSLEWVHADYKGLKDVGFKELILALAQAPSESLFGTELVITLVRHFWNYYYKRIFLACFIPYIIYFLSTIYYVSTHAVEGIDEEDNYALPDEVILRFIIIICVCYFALLEFVSMFRDGWQYWTDVFNYIDWAAFFLNFYTIHHIVREEGEDRDLIRTLVSILVMLMWIKTFYWLRLFSGTSFYIRLIRETLYDIKYFLVLFLFILMCFGSALTIMNQGRNSENKAYSKFFDVDFLDALLQQYIFAIGNYDDTGSYELKGGDIYIWVLFILATFVTQITFLNMLIAIMGDTFDRVSEVKSQSAMAEKIKILADYVTIVRRSDVDADMYLFATTPAQLGEEE